MFSSPDVFIYSLLWLWFNTYPVSSKVEDCLRYHLISQLLPFSCYKLLLLLSAFEMPLSVNLWSRCIPGKKHSAFFKISSLKAYELSASTSVSSILTFVRVLCHYQCFPHFVILLLVHPCILSRSHTTSVCAIYSTAGVVLWWLTFPQAYIADFS